MSRNLVVRLLAESAGVREKNAGGMCSPELVALSPDDQVVEAVQLMREHAVRRLPVAEGGRAVGIVSLGDPAVERRPEPALSGIAAAEPHQ